MKAIVAVLLGVLVGGFILFVLTEGFKRSPSSPVVLVPPEATPGSSQLTEAERLERVRSRLFEEGVTVSSKVNKIFPGIGFTVIDQKSTELFVHWTQSSPDSGRDVSIRGTIKRVEDEAGGLRDDSGYSSDLENFLQDQSIFIEASEVLQN